MFQLPLPGRGHAGAAHPERPEAVAFARRPGTFALVIDCRSGAVLAELESPENRHFMGHGTFSADGSLLFTPENAYDLGEGRIGIWDAAAGYRRIGEFRSGGVGPHEALFLPGTGVLAIANGGIDTHPDSGRAKLNLPVMKPNLAYATADGEILETVDLPPDWHLNSIRHLAVRSDGLVAAAMQWEGDIAVAPPLLMLHRRGGAPVFAAFEGDAHRQMQGYAGSVAMSRDGQMAAISSPRGSLVQCFDAETGAPLQSLAEPRCPPARRPNAAAWPPPWWRAGRRKRGARRRWCCGRGSCPEPFWSVRRPQAAAAAVVPRRAAPGLTRRLPVSGRDSPPSPCWRHRS
ncbi:DUF1513 domain-containing protein [Mangrovicoccus ximenensis]|uniref:DUF1513 domain-containing protein n=1 Tax=Mangrovicoccus ximenensis TaxID=1911570 RepID=UPI001F2F00FF|nr:DUF1513 domain-containing protein [Mangrovicoccus ximenensis]